VELGARACHELWGSLAVPESSFDRGGAGAASLGLTATRGSGWQRPAAPQPLAAGLGLDMLYA